MALRSLLGGLTSKLGGGPARCDGPAIDSPSGDAAGQLMIEKQTFQQHAVQSATPFVGLPPTDETKAGPLPPRSWMPPYQPLHPDKRLSDITASSANSAARSSPGSSDLRATGVLASTDGCEETMRRISLWSEGGAPTTPSAGFAEGEEACETHALQPEPTTARGAAEGAAGGAAAAGAPTPDPAAEAVEEVEEQVVRSSRRPARPAPSTLHSAQPQRCPWRERACRA